MPCPLCDDTGWKPVEEQGVRRVVRCDCWRAQVGRNRLADANIPKRYLHCTLDNFTAYNESLEKAVARARRVADASVVNQGCCSKASPQVGKTHLLAVLKQVLNRPAPAVLLRHARVLRIPAPTTVDPTTEIEVLRPVMTADCGSTISAPRRRRSG
jgi:DNA replication protein DnaC